MAIAAALHPRVTPFNGVNNDYSHSSEDDDDVRDSSSSIDLLPLERAVSEDARSQDSHGFTGLLRTNVRDGVQQALRPFLSGNDRGGPWAPIPQNDSGYAYESGIGPDLGRPAMSSVSSLREMILASWLNSLLVFVPVGLASYLSGMSPILTFITNVIAIVPLSALLTDATERIANDAGDTVGALLNISLGNLVELIIFVALVNNHIRIVQASILGSIIVNLLLILGSALFASTFSRHDASAPSTSNTQLLSCLLLVSVFVFLMPTAFDYTFEGSKGADKAILKMSRISAIMVLVIYVLYFVHELRTRPVAHDAIPAEGTGTQRSHWAVPEPQIPSRSRAYTLPPRTIRFADDGTPTVPHFPGKPADQIEMANLDKVASSSNDNDIDPVNSFPGRPLSTEPSIRSRRHSRSNSGSAATSRAPSAPGFMRSGPTTLELMRTSSNQAHVQHRPTGSRFMSIVVLVVTSALMSMCAEFLVSTIDAVTHQGHLSEPVIGLIILPIVGNIAEYITVVTVAAKDKLDLAVAVAVGSSIQIALCVTPLTIIAGWILNRQLALTFNIFEMATLLGSVLIVNMLILNDGGTAAKTNGLKGALMCACYAIIGLGAYLSPEEK
ncbi:hypothetical protein VD0002_g4950 [Verticillium dahliae]|uniref:Sodium/calcium exchanger membrane region domain-containing protein n=1 Tax=Verticillium dahliae TaxID=27337 RepID=A0AA44WB74_VERDA|nr:hypothetical protein BJF96_g9370 [Verticillium dahliae]PNH50726.1 hypothetical protein VD0003_g6459 [Verticillium dahliae]PNH63413.1 hypothetical protein VD0002_g4950 [Verticillium dahliae]